MDILQVFHQRIPHKKNIIALLQKQKQQDISKSLLRIIKDIKKEVKDIRMINLFCSEFYDMLYHHIMFDKIKVMKKVLRLFEDVATPISCMGEVQWSASLKKLTKIKI